MITTKCEYCGAPNKSGEKFCLACGAANSFYDANDEKEFHEAYEIAKVEANTAKWIMIGMVVFCIVLCGTVFGIFAMVG